MRKQATVEKTGVILTFKSSSIVLTVFVEDMSGFSQLDAEAIDAEESFSFRLDNTKARASLPVNLFDDYVYQSDGDSIQLSLNLTTLLDCLSLFGSSSEETTATLTYSTVEAILKLSLEEAGILTTCDISTIYRDDSDIESGLFTEFLSKAEDAQVILKSDQLHEQIQEISDFFGLTALKWEIRKNPDDMRLSGSGVLGRCEITIPRSSEAIISFRCDNDLSWTYPLQSVQLGMKALSISKETFIRINSRGLACIQHQVESFKGQDVYIDFLMTSEDLSDDQSDDEVQNDE